MTFQSWWWKVIYLHWTVVLRNWNREHGDRNQGKYKTIYIRQSFLNLRIALIYLIDLQKNVDLFYFKNLLSRWLFYFYLLSRVQILQLIGGWEFKKLLIGQGRNMFQAFLFYEETTFFMQFFFHFTIIVTGRWESSVKSII